ncbi:MAG: calcium-binding protein, partial [Dongiaceae bacterium]
VNLTVTVNDKGNTGTGGAKSDSEVITLDVQPVNDAPVAAVPASITVTEDAASDITGISFSDVDAGTNDVTVTLSVSAGTLIALSGPFVAVTGSGTGSIMLTGTVSAINSFISGGNVDYTTPLNDTAAQTLTVSIDDGGNTGSGGAKTDTESVTLNVTPVNDAPTGIALSPSKVDEETAGAVVGLLTVTDPDTGDTHTFTVDDSRFEIVGGQLQLKAGQSLDFETEPSVTVQVTAKDSGNLTHTEIFVISVNDTTGSSTGGTAGPDSLAGTNQDDTLSGGAGNDTLEGGGAGDSLDGGADSDNLDGGAGNDTLDGGAGIDLIVGGTGNDTIVWDLLDSAVDGGAGIDTLALNGADIDLSLAPVSGIEVISMLGSGANIVVLSAFDVVAISDTDTITIAGETGDTVDGGGGWTFAGADGKGNDVYTQSTGFGTATLVIDQDVAFV